MTVMVGTNHVYWVTLSVCNLFTLTLAKAMCSIQQLCKYMMWSTEMVPNFLCCGEFWASPGKAWDCFHFDMWKGWGAPLPRVVVSPHGDGMMVNNMPALGLEPNTCRIDNGQFVKLQAAPECSPTTLQHYRYRRVVLSNLKSDSLRDTHDFFHGAPLA